jgi:hypothetical protein
MNESQERVTVNLFDRRHRTRFVDGKVLHGRQVHQTVVVQVREFRQVNLLRTNCDLVLARGQLRCFWSRLLGRLFVREPLFTIVFFLVLFCSCSQKREGSELLIPRYNGSLQTREREYSTYLPFLSSSSSSGSSESSAS